MRNFQLHFANISEPAETVAGSINTSFNDRRLKHSEIQASIQTDSFWFHY